MIKFRNKKPTRTSPKKILKDYKQYREQLSIDFNHRCAYCDDYDTFRNSSFEIDHFIPQKYLKKKKVNDYDNLVYACKSCNNAKSAIWPSETETISIVGNTGWIDPCSEEYEKQFTRNEHGTIIPVTPIGVWMHDKLKLWKDQHRVIWNIERLDIICERIYSNINLLDANQKTELIEFYHEKEQWIRMLMK